MYAIGCDDVENDMKMRGFCIFGRLDMELMRAASFTLFRGATGHGCS